MVESFPEEEIVAVEMKLVVMESVAVGRVALELVGFQPAGFSVLRGFWALDVEVHRFLFPASHPRDCTRLSARWRKPRSNCGAVSSLISGAG